MSGPTKRTPEHSWESQTRGGVQMAAALLVDTSDVSEVVQNGAKRFVRITILAGYKLCSSSLGRLGGY